jgi:CubicO group peptidase (beta-lactamase class C family)
MDVEGVWEGPSRIYDAPGMVEVEIGIGDRPTIVVTLHAIGLATLALTDVCVANGALAGELGTNGSVTLTPDGTALQLRFEGRAGESMDVTLRRAPDDRTGDGPYPYVDAIVVACNGDIVDERYFCGTTAGDLHTQQSCTKSISSMVFGTAVDRGEVDLDAPVWKYLTDRPHSRWVSERYDATVHHLLCMSVGLDWNEEPHYTDSRNDNTRMNASGDWIGYVLDRGLQTDFPPGRFEYQSGLSILVAAVLRAATGRTLDDLARERLFGPIGIDHFQWTRDGNGNPHAGGGLLLRPRDMVRLGQVMLEGGGGVLSKEWIELSTRVHSTDEATNARYGYKWFLGDLPVGDRTYGAIVAGGYGGQSLMIIRELGLVIQSNAHDWFGDGSLGKIAVAAVEAFSTQ